MPVETTTTTTSRGKSWPSIEEQQRYWKDKEMSDDLFSFFDPKHTRADQIEKHFKRFFKENPHFWKLFKRFTFEAINRGFSNYSASAVFERARWHVSMETKSEDRLKLCNDYRAYYARMFHVAYPELKGFFRTRKRRSMDRPAIPGDPPPHFDPIDTIDTKLDQRLQDLLNEID